MDIHTPSQRAFNMSRIKGKNTKPEETVRKMLWKNGNRYRLYSSDNTAEISVESSIHHQGV